MLYDENLEYSEITKKEYEYNLDDILNEDAKLVKLIVVFYKNRKTKEIKKVEYSAENYNLKAYDLTEWEIFIKYYVEKIKQFDIYKFHCQEVGEAYHIHGLGYFYISSFYSDMKPFKNEKIKKLFDEYDRNYHNIKFPFNDEEFLTSNIYKNK